MDISFPINPWQILGLSPNASRDDIKMAFRQKITQPQRQYRALISLANHVLTSTTSRYERQVGTNTFVIKNADCFMVAESGNAKRLANITARKRSIVEEAD